jgi:FixJ family two-component response regulator
MIRMSERRVRVAVIDDDPSVRRALQRILNVMDVSVRGYASGEEFLASLQGEQPDCVVLDLHMPGMSGLEVQEQLNGLAERPPVIIVTGHHEPGMRRRCILAGAAGYLRKPIDGELLRRAIHQAIGAGP